MKRLVDYFLMKWRKDPFRMPLLLRGARQIGKTFAVRQLGKTYESFVEINFELTPRAIAIFEEDLYPERIIAQLSLMTKQQIIPGKTLLFLDEAQMAPSAITSLRYFYELMPELHVIAAGSLLDFAIEKHGIPVGRVECLYMYPLSFVEYLVAIGEVLAVQELLHHDKNLPLFQILHDKLLQHVAHYLALGGMPQAIQNWIMTKIAFGSAKVHTSILNVYRQDFDKYARVHQIKYVEQVFKQIPEQLGRKFKYSLVEGDYRKRELSPALDLLITAGIARKVLYASGQSVPLGAQVDVLDYKVLFLDTGLAQACMGLDLAAWFLQSDQEFINKGALVESFVGQEIAVYSACDKQQDLYYWHKDSAPQQAEIDYLMQIDRNIIPVEVKSGDGRTLKSIQYFLSTHKQSPYGIRFSTNNYSVYNHIHAYPLYAIAQVIMQTNPQLHFAIQNLIE